MKTLTTTYKIVIQKDQRTGTGETCFSSFVPELGISADGDTFEETVSNTKQLIKFHVENLAAEGEDIPMGDPSNIFICDTIIELPSKDA